MYLERLKAIETHRSTHNWDGDGESELDLESMKIGREWLKKYGNKLPMAHVDCDIYGRLTVEWDGAGRHVIMAIERNPIFNIVGYHPKDKNFLCEVRSGKTAFEILKIYTRG
jgi:hypothetical protein